MIRLMLGLVLLMLTFHLVMAMLAPCPRPGAAAPGALAGALIRVVCPSGLDKSAGARSQ